MNTKATTLFFILIALTNATKTDGLSTSAVQPETNAAVIGLMEEALTDLSVDQETAITNFASKINEFLGIEVPRKNENPVIHLASLLDYKNYEIEKFADVPDNFDLVKHSEELLAAIPHSDALMKAAGNDKEKAAKAALAEFRKVGQAYELALKKGLLNQWFTQVEATAHKLRSHEELSEDPTINIEQHMTRSKAFLNSLKEKLKASGEAYTQAQKLEEFQEIRSSLPRNIEKFYNSVAQLVLEFTNLLTSPLDFLSLAAIELLRQAQEADLNREQSKLEAAKERIVLLTATAAVLEQELEEFHEIKELKNYHHVNSILNEITYYAYATNDQNDGAKLASSQVNDWAIQVFQGSLDAIVELPAEAKIDLAKVHPEVVKLLNLKFTSFAHIRHIKEIVERSANLHKITSGDSKKLSGLIRSLDLLIYLEPSQLSNEQLKTLYRNVHAIHTADSSRINTIEALKVLLNAEGMFPFKDDNSAAFTAIYELTLACADHLPENKPSLDQFDLFDHCLETTGNSEPKTWFNDYRLTAKVLNLLFTSKDSTSMTTFPFLKASDKEVKQLDQVLAANPKFKKAIESKFETITGEKDVKKVSGYSGQTFEAKRFHHINREVKEHVVETDNKVIDRAEVKVKFLEHPITPNKITIDAAKNRVGEDTTPTKDDHNQFVAGENPFSGATETIEEERPSPPRIKKGPQFNIVNQVIGRLPADIHDMLKIMTFDQFVQALPGVEEKDGVQYVNHVVKVTRRESPCHPARQGLTVFGDYKYC